MRTTKIKKCTCEHVFQDLKYGKGLRVCNPTDKEVMEEGSFRKVVRCTVCSKEH